MASARTSRLSARLSAAGCRSGAFGGRSEIMDCLSPIGPVYQAGTLSGNPLAMAAGLAQLRELERLDGWRRLEQLGAAFEEGVRDAIDGRAGQFTFHRVGSMFCLFFTGGPVGSLADAQRSDREAFKRFFHRCLEAGVYLAPSQFETGFLSLAHTPDDIERTVRIMGDALRHSG